MKGLRSWGYRKDMITKDGNTDIPPEHSEGSQETEEFIVNRRSVQSPRLYEALSAQKGRKGKKGQWSSLGPYHSTQKHHVCTNDVSLIGPCLGDTIFYEESLLNSHYVVSPLHFPLPRLRRSLYTNASAWVCTHRGHV